MKEEWYRVSNGEESGKVKTEMLFIVKYKSLMNLVSIVPYQSGQNLKYSGLWNVLNE